MGSGIVNEGDPDRVDRGFEPHPKGEYQVNRIQAWIKVDEQSGDPVFLPYGERIGVRLRFGRIDTGDEIAGPPWCATPSDLNMLNDLLRRSMGACVTADLKTHPTAFLYELKELLDRKEIALTVRVDDQGWINRVNGLYPPEDFYTVRYDGIYMPGGQREGQPLDFASVTRTNQKGNSYTVVLAYLGLIIVGDMWGHPSPYEGHKLIVRIKDPFADPLEKDGVPVQPRFKVTQTGATPVDVRRLEKFLEALCPDLDDAYTWMTDPAHSPYKVNEARFPLAVIDALAKRRSEMGLVAVAQVKVRNGYANLDLESMKPYQGPQKAAPAPPSLPAAPPPTTDPKPPAPPSEHHLTVLFRKIEQIATDLAPYGPVFESTDIMNPRLTQGGVRWCQEHIMPVWDEIGLPKDATGKRDFLLLNAEQAQALLKKLQGDAERRSF